MVRVPDRVRTSERAPFERGFSLSELAVVAAIIGVLAVIAIPMFLGQRDGAADRAAQVNLATAGRAVSRGCLGGDAEAVAACLTEREPVFLYTTGASNSEREISFSLDGGLVGAVLSQSGTCWAVRVEGRTLRYGGGEVEVCQASRLEGASIAGTSFGDASELEER